MPTPQMSALTGSVPTRMEQNAELPLTARILRAYMRSGLRGQTRVTLFLARLLKSLQAVPIAIADRSPVYMDLRLTGSHGWLEMSPWPDSPFELAEQQVMRRFVRSGQVVYDIGANVGLHTVLLSQLVGPSGRVVAFEPNPELAGALRRTVGELPNAVLYCQALSDRSSDAVLFVPEDRSMSSLADWTNGRDVGPTKRVACEQVRLDDLIESGLVPAPDFIKCDVEGAESMVFEGGRRALNRVDAPMILFEANRHATEGFGFMPNDAMDVLASFEVARYRFFEVREGGAVRAAETVDPAYPNLLAVPRARLSDPADLHGP
jgi:FkbM family methyltransferase